MPGSPTTFAPVHQFIDLALPAMLRKLRLWKGLHPDRHRDVLDDLRQELLLDYLENRTTIAKLSMTDRHVRWFRLVERHHYRLRMRGRQHLEPSQVLDRVPMPESVGEVSQRLSPAEVAWAQTLCHEAHHLRNGRINLEATAHRIGGTASELRDNWSRLADSLGFDDKFVNFWRRRLVEALLGLGADVLRDRGLVHIHGDRDRRRPDPADRLRRIARIKRHLNLRPLTRELRTVLARFGHGIKIATLDPAEPIAAAMRLQPGDPAVEMWAFEAAIAQRRTLDAAHALRRARHAGADTVPVLLSRARLLEAAGRNARAAQLLSSAAPRHRRDARLRTALANLRRSEEKAPG